MGKLFLSRSLDHKFTAFSWAGQIVPDVNVIVSEDALRMIPQGQSRRVTESPLQTKQASMSICANYLS